MAKFIPEKSDAYVIPLRTLMLFAGGLLAVYGSEHLDYEGAGPLGVVFAAFVSNYFWCKDGWEVEENPVGTAFEIFWMFFEPALFGITGAAIKIDELDSHTVTYGLSILLCTGVVRILSTALIAFGDNLNLKEKVCNLYFIKRNEKKNIEQRIKCSYFWIFVDFCVHCLYGKGNRSSSARSTILAKI